MKKEDFLILSSCLDQFLTWPTREKEKDELNESQGSLIGDEEVHETKNNCGDYFLDKTI